MYYYFFVGMVLQLYVNGVYGDTAVGASAYTAQQSASISIGRNYDEHAEDAFHGSMSCLQIFNKVLTKQELIGHQYRCQEDVGLPSMVM